MKKHNYAARWIVLLIIFCFPLKALSQVSISVQILPPYYFNIADYESHPQQLLITIINTSMQVQRIQLRGQMTGDNGVEVAARSSYKNKTPIVLTPGQVTVLTGNDINTFLDYTQLVFTGITPAQIVHNNGVPEGNYTLCLQAYNYDTNALISSSAPIGCSNNVSLINVQPPNVLSPIDGTTITSQGTQVFTISWNTPAGAPPATQYRIRIAEILGNRSPNDAIMSATTPLFFDKTVMTNLYVYNPGDPQLTSGRSYALMVQAIDPTNSVNFVNSGQSVVTSFTYNSNAPVNIVLTPVAAPTTPAAPSTTSPAAIAAAYGTMAKYVSVASGHLTWYLRQSEENQTSGMYSTMGTKAHNLANRNVSLHEISYTYAIKNTGARLVEMYDGDVPLSLLKNVGTLAQKTDYLLTTATTDANGNFQAPVFNLATQQAYLSQQTTTTSNNNSRTVTSYSANTITYVTAYQVYATFSDPQFVMPVGDTVAMTAYGGIAMGEIKTMANTYRYQPTLKASDGSAITDATVSLFRRADFYNINPTYKGEGNLAISDTSAPRVINGVQYIKVANVNSINNEATGLFFNSPTDQYLVLATDPRCLPYNAVVTTAAPSLSPASVSSSYSSVAATASAPSLSPGSLSSSYSSLAAAASAPSLSPGSLSSSYSSLAAAVSAPLVASASGPATVLQQNIALQFTTPVFSGHVFKYVNNVKTNVTNAIIRFGVSTPSATAEYTAANAISSGVSGLGAPSPTAEYTAATDSSGNFSIPLGSYNSTYDTYVYVKPRTLGRFFIPGYTIATPHTLANQFTISSSPITYTVGLPTDKTNFGDYQDTVVIDVPGQQKSVQINVQIPTYPVTGKITDLAGNPIPSPQIRWQSGGSYLPTNSDGTFSVTANAGSDVLIVEQPGFSTQNVNVNITKATTIPVIRLSPINYKVLCIVKDQNNKAIQGAVVSVNNTVAGNTDVNGNFNATATSADAQISISGPPGTNYITAQAATSGQLIDTVQVKLYHGVTVSGVVTAANQPLANVAVSVDGLDYLNTTTDANGKYSLNVYQGYNQIDAALSGYVSGQYTANISKDTTLNLSLTTSSFNMTKLLGFNVQIDNVTSKGANKVISGSFINIQSNSVFSVASTAKIPFSNVEVSIQNNIAVPVGGTITTDAVSLNVTAYNYLPAVLTNNGNFITVVGNSSGTSGAIQGFVNIDFNAFNPAGATPLTNNTVLQYLETKAQTSPVAIAAFNSDGTFAGADSLYLASSATQQFNLYGFQFAPDLTRSKVKADGLHFGGSVSLSSVPLLNGSAALNIKDLTVGTKGYITTVTSDSTLNASFSIAKWTVTVNSLTVGAAGFSLNGNLSMALPASSPIKVAFTNMLIGPDQIYGGSFTLPDSGLNILGIVKLVGGSTPFTFGKLSGTNTYYVGGSGTLSVSKIFDAFTVNSFLIQSDGGFNVQVPVNYQKDFGSIATVDINGININTINTISVDILGQFELKLPNFQATVGNIHYTQGGGVSVDELGFNLDMGTLGTTALDVKYINTPDTTGFEGSGAFTIAKLGSAQVGFKYYKVPNGMVVGANFATSTKILLGDTGFAITKLGGGFELDPGNQWSVNILGTITDDSGESGISTDVNLTVASGPVITGTSKTTYANLQEIDGNITLDIPDSKFSVEITKSMDFVPGLANGSDGLLVVGLSPSDTYFFLGAEANIKGFGIFNASGNICLGYNLNVAKHQTDLGQYYNYIDPAAIVNGIFTGASAQVNSSFNAGFNYNVIIGDIEAHFDYSSYGYLSASFISKVIKVKLGTNWDMGASVSVGYWPLSMTLGVDVGFGASLTGTLDLTNNYILLNASGTAYFEANYNDSGCGNDGGLNWNCCCWGIICWPSSIYAQVCVSAGMSVGFDSRKSNPISISL